MSPLYYREVARRSKKLHSDFLRHVLCAWNSSANDGPLHEFCMRLLSKSLFRVAKIWLSMNIRGYNIYSSATSFSYLPIQTENVKSVMELVKADGRLTSNKLTTSNNVHTAKWWSFAWVFFLHKKRWLPLSTLEAMPPSLKIKNLAENWDESVGDSFLAHNEIILIILLRLREAAPYAAAAAIMQHIYFFSRQRSNISKTRIFLQKAK